MRGYAYNYAQASTYFGWEVTTLEDAGDSVLVNVREIATAQDRQIRASFVVGCDGANSSVREFMGCTQIDHKATHRSLIIDITPFVAKDNPHWPRCLHPGSDPQPVDVHADRRASHAARADASPG